jgi:hypothetical protein
MSAAARSLYPEANLDHLERQAKELKRALAAGDAEALERVDVAFVDTTTYGEYTMAVSQPTCGWVFEADGFESAACLDIGMPIVMRLLGREEGWHGPLDDREVARVEPLARQVLEDLRVTFEPAGLVGLRKMSYHEDAGHMDAAHPYDIIYLVGYEVGEAGSEPGHRWSFVSLAYPIVAVTRCWRGCRARKPPPTDS